MKVCMVGTGCVGLVSAACLVEAGNNVICFDKDGKKIANLKNGIPIAYGTNCKYPLEVLLHKSCDLSCKLPFL